MKVLLTTPPGKTDERWPPLGLLYLAASIKKSRKDDVSVVDAFCRNMGIKQLAEYIIGERPDIVGLSTATHTFLDSIAVLEEVSRSLPEVKIAMGGYHSTFAAEKILKTYPFVDFIFKGEAEHAIVELLECLEKGQDPAGVPGISYIRDGEYVSNEPALIGDLDELPFPDREMVNGIKYGYIFKGLPLTFGKFTTMSTSRGCPYNCSYCSCASFSRHKLRYRSAENVVDEMQMLQDKGYKNVVLVDDNFTHKPERVEKICDLIKARKIKMRFYCEGRVNNASLNMLRKMKRAGFDVIFFGAESASRQVLEYYNKRTTVGQITSAVENAKKANMIVITSFIMGAPVEQREDMEATVDLIRRLRPHGVEVNVLDVLIGTKLWDEMDRLGKIGPEDWKTNHRIYEFMGGNGNGQSHSMEELERFARKGYKAYMDSLMSPAGTMGLAKLMLHNGTARSIVMGNMLNPNLRNALGQLKE